MPSRTITRSFFRNLETRDAVCDEHGPYKASKLPIPGKELWTDCPVCYRKRREEEEREERKRCAMELREWNVRKLLGQASIPDRFLDRRLDNYRTDTPEQTQALAACRAFVNDWDKVRKQGDSIVLIGTPGTGKTHLAAGIAHGVLMAGGSAVYVRAAGIIQAVKESFGNKADTERAVYERFTMPDLLVVDEVGRQYGTDSEKHMLFEVLNQRYERMRPMVVVSNMDPGAFQDYLGSAMLSRLLESGRVVQLKGANYRLRENLRA